ncbi:MAG: hypothetical protein ABFS86_15315 [Planctomycetota bacterium]
MIDLRNDVVGELRGRVVDLEEIRTLTELEGILGGYRVVEP